VLTRGRAVDRDRLRLTLAAVCAIPCGLAVGLRPTTVVLFAAAVVGATACLLLPLRHLPTLLLAITIAMPSLVLKGVGGSGQARAIVAVLALALIRVVMTRTRSTMPAILPLAIGAALGLTLMSALVATTRPANQVGGNADLVRYLGYPLAAVIGYVGGAAARRERATLSIARAFAWLGLVAALLSVWYWAWRALGVAPLSSSLFTQVAKSSGFSSSRSLFPFVEDSPNLGAVMFVLLAAFAAPPLLLAARSRDRMLGVVVVVASSAAVLTTQSRTGLFAAGAAAVTYLWLVERGGGRRSTVALTLVLLVGATAVVFATFPSERRSGDTLQSRVQVWTQASHSFLNDPIIGHGFEYSLVGNFVEQANHGGNSHNQSTHDDLLSALVDAGVVGAAVFIALLGLMIATARGGVADPVSRPLAIGYGCMLAAFVVGGVDNSLTQSAAVATFEWLTFGVIAGVGPRARDLGLSPRRSVSGARRWPANGGATESTEQATACAG
jgi:O-antigen ligase